MRLLHFFTPHPISVVPTQTTYDKERTMEESGRFSILCQSVIAFPYLSEMTSGSTKSRVFVVVALSFAIPSINSRFPVSITQCQILSVGTARVLEFAVVGPLLSIISQFGTPLEWWGGMFGSVGVMGI